MMMLQRRTLLSTACAWPLTAWLQNGRAEPVAPERRLILSSFLDKRGYVIPGGDWRGFSDRVMGGVSDATLDSATVDGKDCIRLAGNVTRENNGGFVQMALYLGRQAGTFDASGYRGIELLVHGNDEDYNLHIRTADCGWHDESYRATFFATPRWQRIRIPWESFAANAVRVPLDTSRLQRIGILGWMREFEADIALAEIALYG